MQRWNKNLIIIVKVGIQMTKVWETLTQQQTTNPPGACARRALRSGSGRPGTDCGRAASRRMASPRGGAGAGRLGRARRLDWGKWAGLHGQARSGRHEAGRRPMRSAPGPAARGPSVPPATRRVYLSLGVSGGSSGRTTAPTLFLLRPPRPGLPRAARARPFLLPPATQHYWPASPHHTAAVAPPHTAPRFHLPLCGRQLSGRALGLHLYSWFGGWKCRRLPIPRRPDSGPGRKASWEVQPRPPPSPHLAPRKSPIALTPNCLQEACAEDVKPGQPLRPRAGRPSSVLKKQGERRKLKRLKSFVKAYGWARTAQLLFES